MEVSLRRYNIKQISTLGTAAAKQLQSCPTLCDPIRWQPTRLPRPWDSPGKNTGVGCHFVLQCMKVKSESEVTQSCPTLSDPMDYNTPGSSVRGIFQARVLEWVAIAFSATLGNLNLILLESSGNWGQNTCVRDSHRGVKSWAVCDRSKIPDSQGLLANPLGRGRPQ